MMAVFSPPLTVQRAVRLAPRAQRAVRLGYRLLRVLDRLVAGDVPGEAGARIDRLSVRGPFAVYELDQPYHRLAGTGLALAVERSTALPVRLIDQAGQAVIVINLEGRWTWRERWQWRLARGRRSPDFRRLRA